MEEIKRDRRFLVGEVKKIMVADAKKEIPSSGRFLPKQYRMDYPGSRHSGLMGIYHSESTGCTVQVGAIVEGTDMVIKNFAFAGSRDECIAWLEKEESLEAVITMLDHLMLRADKE